MTATRLVLRWVDAYTRGLPGDARAARRAELASDVWEQRAAFGDGLGAQLALTSRCVRGIPSDLGWRHAQRAGRRRASRGSVARRLGWALAGMAYAALTMMHGFNATVLVGLDLYGDDWDPAGLAWNARVSATLLTLLVVGAVLMRRLPRAGASLVALGALATPIAFPWGAIVYGPVAFAVTAAAVTRALRLRRAQLETTAG